MNDIVENILFIRYNYPKTDTETEEFYLSEYALYEVPLFDK